MANWKSLHKLRLHSSILTMVIIGLIAFLVLSSNHFSGIHQTTSAPIEYVKVIARKGANIRSIPSTSGSTNAVAPRKTRLKVLEKNTKNDIVNGLNGSWHKVQYKGIVGYVWGNLVE